MAAHGPAPQPSLRLTRRSGVGLAVCALLLISGCAVLPPDVAREPSSALEGGADTTLGRMLAAPAGVEPGQSGFRLLITGRDALLTRVATVDAAEKSLDLQYYSVGDDVTSDLLLKHIAAAADRGVRVRMLLDDIYAPTRQFAWRAMAVHQCIQVRLFNPFYFGGSSSLARLGEVVFDSERLNRRMHNKLWLADNAAAIVGSRNLGDEYFEARTSGNFHDVDLLVGGPIVSDMSRAFDAYWNSASAVPAQAIVGLPVTADGPLQRDRLRARLAACDASFPCNGLDTAAASAALAKGSGALSWASALYLFDPPDGDKPAVPSGIVHGFVGDGPGGSTTRNEMLIVSPYFVPGSAGNRHLDDMVRRGLRVAVLTNSLVATDSLAAHAGYARHRTALLRAGVELYEARRAPDVPHETSHRWGRASPASLHAKFIVQDRARAIVGSLNQDPRSRLHNTEAWVVVDSVDVAGELASLFQEAIDLEHAYKLQIGDDADALVWLSQENGATVRLITEPTDQPWLPLWRSVLGALIPEHLL